jgi:hypothetical protein
MACGLRSHAQAGSEDVRARVGPSREGRFPMQERDLSRIEPDRDVCEINGDKLGTVARVYRHDVAVVGAAISAMRQLREEVVEVKSGPLGLGTHYYIPMSAIHHVTTGSVFVDRPREEIDQTDWQTEPAYLEEMS